MANKKIQELTVSGFEKLQAEYRQLNDVEKVQNQHNSNKVINIVWYKFRQAFCLKGGKL